MALWTTLRHLLALLLLVSTVSTTAAIYAEPREQTTDWAQFDINDATGFILGTTQEVAAVDARTPAIQSVGENEIVREIQTSTELVIAEVEGDWREIADEIMARYPNAEPDWRRSVDSLPNDRYVPEQWALTAAGINLTALWNAPNMPVITGTVKVMVIDTGCGAHPELIYTGCIFPPSYQSGADGHGHATHVSGSIAATSDNNGQGIASFKYRYGSVIQLWGCKALSDQGSGSSSDVVWCIDQAKALGMDIINLSLGAPGDSTYERDHLNLFHNTGGISVCAAGNNGPDGPRFSPGQYCRFSVGAYNSSRAEASFSNRFSTVMAPGVSIVSSHMYDLDNNGTKDPTYSWLSGTSMASPHVAGVAALVRAKWRNWTADQVVQRVLDTSDQVVGKPAPNVFRALTDPLPDTEAPILIEKLPALNATNVLTTTNVTVKFSEPVTGVSTTSFSLTDPNGQLAAASVTYDAATKTATLNPVADLAPGKIYTVRLTSAIKDEAGNELAGIQWSFTTRYIQIFMPLAQR